MLVAEALARIWAALCVSAVVALELLGLQLHDLHRDVRPVERPAAALAHRAQEHQHYRLNLNPCALHLGP